MRCQQSYGATIRSIRGGSGGAPGSPPLCEEYSVISEALDQILKLDADEQVRQRKIAAERELHRQLDTWLDVIEDMLEQERRTVPESLYREIAQFLRRHIPVLHKTLVRAKTRDAAQILDVVFDAQEVLKFPQHAQLRHR